MSIVHVTGENFRSEILDASGTVLLDFFAVWCGPCRMVAPILEEIADERPDVKVCKVDVDQEPQLAARYGISSIPTLLVIKNGKIVNQSIGAVPKSSILRML